MMIELFMVKKKNVFLNMLFSLNPLRRLRESISFKN